jgi:hypothetical protein
MPWDPKGCGYALWAALNLPLFMVFGAFTFFDALVGLTVNQEGGRPRRGVLLDCNFSRLMITSSRQARSSRSSAMTFSTFMVPLLVSTRRFFTELSPPRTFIAIEPRLRFLPGMCAPSSINFKP